MQANEVADTDPITDELLEQVSAAGAEYQAATRAREHAIACAKDVARRAFEAGMPQSEIADMMGVDRARTIRRWLGIMDD
jgi:uncharacterized protein YjcR